METKPELKKMDGISKDLVAERLAQLKATIPEAFADGKIDFDALRGALGDAVDSRKEHYKFTWNGKEESRAFALRPSMGTLRPCEAESKDWATTQNLYIEGDNLEVLKLLQGSYYGQVKMIYIDPPYNTGHDFVYEDDFSDSIESYKQQTGQTDEEGKATRANAETSGRYHTDWLNMMLPRLLLARNLLQVEGYICVSIGEEELSNMRSLMNEVFGEENYRNTLTTRRYDKNLNRQFMEEGLFSLNVGLEYILVYSKSTSGKLRPVFRAADEERRSEGYWKGFWNAADRPTMRYELLGVCPTEGQWKWQESVAKEAVDNYVMFKRDFADKMTIEEYWKETGETKRFLRRNPDGKGKNLGVEHWVAPTDKILRTSNWTDLLASKPCGLPFDSPKNPDVLLELARMTGVENDELALDFFSGSATTAHAVMQLNAEDGGNRKFIMVQLPEVCAADSEAAKAGYKNICEIGKERIRRAGAKIIEEVERKNEEAKRKTEEELNLEENGGVGHTALPDVGFKVFKLDTSNLIPWNPNPEDLEQSLLAAVHNALVGRTTDDILYEVLLKCNLPLTLPIVKETCGTNTIHVIGDGALMICLDQTITSAVAEEMIRLRNEKYKPQVPMQVVFLDNGFTDKEKANAVVTLKQAGVEEKAIQSI